MTAQRTSLERLVRSWIVDCVSGALSGTEIDVSIHRPTTAAGVTYSITISVVLPDGLSMAEETVSYTTATNDTSGDVLDALAAALEAQTTIPIVATVAGSVIHAVAESLWFVTADAPVFLAAVDATVPPVIFGRTNSPPPANPDAGFREFLFVVLGGSQTTGRAWTGAIDLDTETQTTVSNRTTFVDVTAVGPRARYLADLIRSSADSEDPSVQVLFQSYGAALVDAGAVIDATIQLDTVWERQAVVSVEVAQAAVTVQDGRLRIIEQVEATGTIGSITSVTTEPE